MNSKIYVGNILYEITDQDLRDLFSAYGEVTAAEVVRYQKSKRSKGFGFVRMATVEQAQAAVQALNDQDYRGRKLFLDFARAEDPTAEVREKQQNTAQRAAEKPAQTFTPMQPQVQEQAPVQQPEPQLEVEEVHPEVHVEPEQEFVPPAPEPEPVQEAPAPQVQPQQEAQPIRNFGTIFSNSPGKNEDQ